jgi:hypothetical protein
MRKSKQCVVSYHVGNPQDPQSLLENSGVTVAFVKQS